jgi:hypothetical protein
MEDKGIPHRYGNGAVLWHKGDSRYYHITDRYVSVDTDELLYRVHDSTHRNNQLYCEEDLEDTFIPAGFTMLGVMLRMRRIRRQRTRSRTQSRPQ